MVPCKQQMQAWLVLFEAKTFRNVILAFGESSPGTSSHGEEKNKWA